MDHALSRRRLLGAGLFLPFLAAPAGAAALRAEGPGAVLTLPGAGAWRLVVRARPPALLLHLPEHRGPGPSGLGAAGPVRAARWEAGARRLVLELSGPVAAPEVRREGGALVVSLRPGPAANFARLDGRAVSRGEGAARPLVVLDPGHGGRDPGAVGATGLREKEVVLAVSQGLRRRLEAGGRCRVGMTRGGDAFVPLARRVEIARARGADLFVSVHADSAPGARGASVYTLSETASDALSAALARRENAADAAGGLRLPPVPPEVQRILISLVRQETAQGSRRMAGLTVGALRPRVPLLGNAHRQAAFAVLKAPDVPSVLVELGFLSDARDEAALRRAEHRERLAAALAEAVEGYLARPGVG